MHPTSKKLCEAYKKLHKEGHVAFPLGERHKKNIDSIAKTVESRFFGVQRFRTPEQKAVAYLYLLIKNHPVTDGNKRLAVLWFEVFCTKHNLQPNLAQYSLDEYAIAIEQSLLEMESILKLLEDILFPKTSY